MGRRGAAGRRQDTASHRSLTAVLLHTWTPPFLIFVPPVTLPRDLTDLDMSYFAAQFRATFLKNAWIILLVLRTV